MAVQIQLSDLNNHVGKKIKIFGQILSSCSSNEFVIADKTDFTLLLTDENIGSKHLQVGNFIKVLNPEISIKEGKGVIKIGGKTSIFSTPKFDGVITPPADDPLVKTLNEPTTLATKIKSYDLGNSIKISSTFGMEKYQVIHLTCLFLKKSNKASSKIFEFEIFCHDVLNNFLNFRLCKAKLLPKLLKFKGKEKLCTKTKRLGK